MNIQAIAHYLNQGCKPKGSGVYAIVILPPSHVRLQFAAGEFQVINREEFNRGRYDASAPVIIDAAGVPCGEMDQFLREHRKAILIPGNFGGEELFEEAMAKCAAPVGANV